MLLYNNNNNIRITMTSSINRTWGKVTFAKKNQRETKPHMYREPASHSRAMWNNKVRCQKRARGHHCTTHARGNFASLSDLLIQSLLSASVSVSLSCYSRIFPFSSSSLSSLSLPSSPVRNLYRAGISRMHQKRLYQQCFAHAHT